MKLAEEAENKAVSSTSSVTTHVDLLESDLLLIEETGGNISQGVEEQITEVNNEDIRIADQMLCCSLCGKMTTRRQLYLHEYSAHCNPSNCSLCGKSYRSQKSVLKHIKDVHGTSKICEVCGKGFKTKFNLDRHTASCAATKRKQTRSRRESKEVCPLCQNKFSNTHSLNRHIRTRHQYMLNSAGSFFMRHIVSKYNARPDKTTWHCRVCHISFRRKYDYCCHQVRKHPGNTSERVTTSQGFMVVSEHQEKLKLLKCNLCQFGCSLYKDLRNHKIQHHKGEKVFACSECEKCFVHISSLSQHKTKVHKGVQFQCLGDHGLEGCGKYFKKKDTLKKHKKKCGQLNMKPFEELSRWQKKRHIKIKTAKFMEGLKDFTGEERILMLRAMAETHPEVLDSFPQNPLMVNDIIEVLLLSIL